MTKYEPFEYEYMDCDCKGARHTIRLCFDPEEGDLFMDVQLSRWYGFFRRCWLAFLYVFNLADSTCQGHWDCTLLNDHAVRIKDLCERSIRARQ